jgi:hypothetical protein
MGYQNRTTSFAIDTSTLEVRHTSTRHPIAGARFQFLVIDFSSFISGN